MTDSFVAGWHRVVEARDPEGLNALIADDAVFHSPVVHTPQVGKDITIAYLSAAVHVLLNDSFHYVREVHGERDSVLEFEVEIDGIHVNGVDMIHFAENGQIDEFKVMLRPLKGVNIIHQKMGEMLAQLAGK